jgi:hypothetical protein
MAGLPPPGHFFVDFLAMGLRASTGKTPVPLALPPSPKPAPSIPFVLFIQPFQVNQVFS